MLYSLLGRTESRKVRVSILMAMLLLSELFYVCLLRLNAINGLQPVLAFLACMGALFVFYGLAYGVVRNPNACHRFELLTIAVGTVLFRLTLLPVGLPHDAGWTEYREGLGEDMAGRSVTYERFLLFDSDHWRYLWDGHVWAHGVNPFQFAPSDSAVDRFAEGSKVETDRSEVWIDIRDNINHPGVRTIYPPLAQFLFRFSHFLAPGSVAIFKAIVIAVDLLAVLFIGMALRALNRPVSGVILYGWNPLIVKVIAGSAHIDALLSALLAATAFFLIRRKRFWAAWSFGLAVLSKLSPLILLPFVLRRIGWKYSLLGGVVFLLGYLPFLEVGTSLWDGLRTFGKDWQFNGGPFVLVQTLAGMFTGDPRLWASLVCGSLVLGIVAWLAYRDEGKEEFPAHASLAMGSLLVLSPAVMPWYLTWVLPLAVLAGHHVWVCFSGLVCLAFLVMINGTEASWVLWLEYGIFIILIRLQFRRIGRSRFGIPKLSPVTTL